MNDDFATIRKALTMDEGTFVERRHTKGHEALSRIEEQYEDAQRKLSCGYATGTGTNCGECLDCLKVNWHFAQEAVGNLKEQLQTALRERDEAQLGYGALNDRAQRAEEQLEAAPSEREMRCFARVLDPDRYPLPGEDFTEIINEALHALRRVMPLLASSPASESGPSLREQLETYERFEDEVRDMMDFMPKDKHYDGLNEALGRIRAGTSNPARSPDA